MANGNSGAGEPDDIQAQIDQLREQVDALMKQHEVQAAGGATWLGARSAAPFALRGNTPRNSHPISASNHSSRC